MVQIVSKWLEMEQNNSKIAQNDSEWLEMAQLAQNGSARLSTAQNGSEWFRMVQMALLILRSQNKSYTHGIHT